MRSASGRRVGCLWTLAPRATPPSGGLANKITTDFVCVKRSAAQYAELAAEQAKRARALTESLESIQALQKIQRGSAGVKG